MRYCAQLDADLSIPSQDKTEKLKLLITDPQGLRDVEEWITRSFHYVDPHGLPYAIMPRGMLFISGPGDLKFEGAPAREYNLLISYKIIKAVEQADFDVLLGIFRRYGQPYAGAFKYEYLWDVRNVEYQAWCPICKNTLATPSASEEEAEAIGKAHEEKTGHSCRIRMRKLDEPVINKY